MEHSLSPVAIESPIHQVTSLCPECLNTIPGRVVDTPGGVVMKKECREHGFFETPVCSDLAAYERIRHWPRKVTAPARPALPVARGCPHDCGLCPEHDQHTCLAILEVTSRCDLHCPVCLADSRAQGRDLELGVIETALKKLLQAEGGAPPLQLGGGEPTRHPELVDIVRLAARLGFVKTEIETNGLRLARSPELAQRLGDAGLTGVYLQMDGLSDEVFRFLRGADLLATKQRAIDNCLEAGLQVVLSVTVVPGVNDGGLWQMIRFAVARRLTGINFQPIALSGRYPPRLARSGERMTAGHFMREVERQSGGQLLAADLMPLSCPDPRCGLLSYVLIKGGRPLPLRRFLQEQKLVDHVADLSDWDSVIGSLISGNPDNCGCGNSCAPQAEPADVLLGADFFSIGFHGMMDAYSFDLDRARRCCVHLLSADGTLIPFCLNNIMYRKAAG